MAGPYYSVIKSTDGRVLNVYHAASVAVGIYLPVEMNGAVASTSPTSFTIRPGENFTIDDVVSSVIDATPAHQVEIVKDDDPKARFFIFNAALATTNTARKVQRLTLTPGVYKLLTRVAGPA